MLYTATTWTDLGVLGECVTELEWYWDDDAIVIDDVTITLPDGTILGGGIMWKKEEGCWKDECMSGWQESIELRAEEAADARREDEILRREYD